MTGGALGHGNLNLLDLGAVFDQVADGIRLGAVVQVLGKLLHHGAVEHPHAAGGVADGPAGGQADGPADDIAAQHPQGLGLLHRQKPAADDNVGTAFQRLQHGGDVLGQVLAVGVQLHGAVVAVLGGVAQPGLESAGQAQIDGQVDQVKAAGTADGGGLVPAAVVDYHIVILRVFGGQFTHHAGDIALLVVGRNDDQQF